MATVRAGTHSVLVVVDVQVGVLADAWEPARTIANVALAVQRARDSGVPVLWVQHTSEELPTGSAAWHWVPELVPQAGEPLIHKRYNSGFEDTSLDAELARLQATHIVLAGAATNWCIRATAYGALERGYDLTLVEDAHTTTAQEALPGGFVLGAEGVIRDLNIVMTWVRYPGRSNGTVRAAALDFSVPAARG
jgi:nicotinamidase-related amidase